MSCFLLCALAVVGQQEVISGIEIHGNRRIPADTIRARIFTRAGDVYDEAALERDFNSLWNTGYFEDIRFEREETPKGWVIHIYVKERPTIRDIDYVGLNSVSKSDVLTAPGKRWKAPSRSPCSARIVQRQQLHARIGFSIFSSFFQK